MTMTHAPGTPCWVDLMTPDPERARAFYGEILGWTFDESGAEYGGYLMCASDGAAVAGIGKLPEGAPMPTAWTPYLAVHDVAEAAAAVAERGGKVVMPPMEVPGQGHMAMIADPGGAVVGLWQPLAHTGFDAMGRPGAPAWFEVNTRAHEATRAFFTGLFDLADEKIDGMDYWTMHQGGRSHFGVLAMTAEWEGIPPHWMSYFAVADVDAAAASVRALGGEVKHGPFDTPWGRMAVCADPMGAVFSLMRLPAGG